MWAGGVSCKPGELASDAWIGLSRKTKYGSAIKNPGLSCPILAKERRGLRPFKPGESVCLNTRNNSGNDAGTCELARRVLLI